MNCLKHYNLLIERQEGRTVWNTGTTGVMVAWNKGQKGKFGWFTDGLNEQYIKINKAPIGWKRGRSCKTLVGANYIR